MVGFQGRVCHATFSCADKDNNKYSCCDQNYVKGMFRERKKNVVI